MITVVIPVGKYHEAVAEHAIASCRAQTIPVEMTVIYDREGRGAGATRNRGLEQVKSEFVVFLDADDLLEPDYAERTLQAYDGKHYIYSDWMQDGKHISAPDCAFINRTWHVITALLPTAWVKHVGGFDETLTGGEDTDLFMKLRSNGMCGRRLAIPLMHYRTGGQRSKAFIGSAEFDRFIELMGKRYGGATMSCCGEYNPHDDPAVGDRADGDVLAVALWGGNRKERGRISGRLYPRAGNGAHMWVYASDIEASPHLWQVYVETPNPPAKIEPVSDFQTLAALVLGSMPKPTPTPAPTVARIDPLDAPPQPDVFKLLELYRGNHA